MRASLRTGLIGSVVLLPCGHLQATDVGGSILTDTTWSAAGNPFVVTSNILIGNDATLTIEPGVEVRVNQNLVLVVGSHALGSGTIISSGTVADPILFTANSMAVPGDWIGLRFTDMAVDAVYDKSGYVSGSKLEHTIIEFAGGGEPAVHIKQCSPYLVHCEVRHNAETGIFGDEANPPLRIASCEIWDCTAGGGGGGGIRMDLGSGHLLTNNHVHDCVSMSSGGGGIRMNSADNCILDGNLVNNNTGSSGGGIYVTVSNDTSVMNNTITGNSVTGSGGGVLANSNLRLSLIANTISDRDITRSCVSRCAHEKGGVFWVFNHEHPARSTPPCIKLSRNSCHFQPHPLATC